MQLYLVVGFTQTMDDEKYGIRWTTAQCVLVLKLIGVAFDLYDGHKKVSVLKRYIHVLVQKIYIYDKHVRSFCAFSTFCFVLFMY